MTAPWQEADASPAEEWAFRAPGGGVEVFALPRRGRPRYLGPRNMREVWQKVAASRVAHALLHGADFSPRTVESVSLRGDALSTLLIGWHLERDAEARNIIRDEHGSPASWPKLPRAPRRLAEKRLDEAHAHGLEESWLWRPGEPQQSMLAMPDNRLPRWWLWRKTWPRLHEIQRLDPLPAYRGQHAEADRRFIPIHVHEVQQGLLGGLRLFRSAGYLYRHTALGSGGEIPRKIIPVTATLAVDPHRRLHGWRAVVDYDLPILSTPHWRQVGDNPWTIRNYRHLPQSFTLETP